jgi:AraC-like DNA-binding protein
LLLHEDFDLFWVTAGELAMELESGPKLIARRGDLLLLPPLVAGTLRQHAGRVAFWYCHFAFRVSSGKAAHPVHVHLKLPAVRGGPVRRAYGALNCLLNAAGQNAWRREAATITLVSLLAESGMPLKHGSNPVATVTPSHDPRVALLRQRIEGDPAAPWRVTNLASSVNLSPGHLHALWTSALHSSVKGYIVKARLRLAMEKLHQRSGGHVPSVKEVAASCGFSSQHLFCRQFRAVFGVTPSVFRDSAGL